MAANSPVRRLGSHLGVDPSINSVSTNVSVDSDISHLLEEDMMERARAESDGDVEIKSNGSTGSSWYASVFIVVNAALGAGMLEMPLAFHQSGGIVVAVIIQAILMVFIVGALFILAFCSDVHNSKTYQDVVRSMCGRKAQSVSAAVIAVYSYGVCITFFIIVGDQLDKFFSSKLIYGPDYHDHWYMDRRFTITASSLLLVLPLCYPKRIDFLKYVSAASFVCIAYCVVLVIVEYFTMDIDPGPIRTHPDNIEQVFLVIPVICFAYQMHISVVPVYACLKVRTQKEFLKTVMVALVICVFAYTITASFGYLTFGSKVKADILSSYEPTPWVLVAVVLIALKMVASYPILLFVGRTAFESIWAHMWSLTPEESAMGERRRRIVIVTVWFFSSLGLAVIVPDIAVVIAVLGGLAALFIFIFPGLCLLQVLLQGYVRYDASNSHTNRNNVKFMLLMAMSVGYLVIGGFIFGVTTTQALWDDVHSGIKPVTDTAPRDMLSIHI